MVGGSSGIGRECALLLAKQGTETLLIARGKERLQEVVDEIQLTGGKVQAFAADVTSPEEVEQVADQIGSQFGRLDVLIYGAAAFYLSPVEMMDIGIAKHVMEVNYWGAVNTIQAFFLLIRNGQRKSIVLILSFIRSLYATFLCCIRRNETRTSWACFIFTARTETRGNPCTNDFARSGRYTVNPPSRRKSCLDIHE
ncbi:SDR family oxidoreductase [Alicyclobacillus fastidiosus]|uniref:SDR family oxidoreductase n=1 Tax=Alicyclobacillus fastidiosus TaxID=392011 RepID=A0ABY6ZNN9_9BACL|nr:SDR family NAD(P)-dependent oxidoreductase [Alicyclobacillus fastidiosus]WAH44455.1 SDR family oxidoreductase [Alicyclobacillus fastidiosus]